MYAIEPAINTHTTIKKLSAGNVFNKKQAERIVDAQIDFTKNDLKNLEVKMDAKIDRVDMKVDAMEQRFIGMDIGL